MWVRRRLGEDSLNDAFGQLPTLLILLLDDQHPDSRPDLRARIAVGWFRFHASIFGWTLSIRQLPSSSREFCYSAGYKEHA